MIADEVCPDIPRYSVLVDVDHQGTNLDAKWGLTDMTWAIEACDSMPDCRAFFWAPQSGTGQSTGAAWLKLESGPVTSMHYTGGNCLYVKLAPPPPPQLSKCFIRGHFYYDFLTLKWPCHIYGNESCIY